MYLQKEMRQQLKKIKKNIPFNSVSANIGLLGSRVLHLVASPNVLEVEPKKN